MSERAVSSDQFERDPGGAKRAAKDGPVLVVHEGRATHVLLSIEDYRHLTPGRGSLADALAMDGDEDIDFDPPRLDLRMRPADLS